MLSQRLSTIAMGSIRLIPRRMMSAAGTKVQSADHGRQSIDLAKFDPNNYNVPLRYVTMDDTMEPYGSWKTAYAAEKKLANKTLAKGILCFTGACLVLLYGGIFDGVIMPNLDNIMEETEPWDFEKGEDRISV